MSDSYFKYHTQAAVCKRCCARWCNIWKSRCSHTAWRTHIYKSCNVTIFAFLQAK